MNKVVIKFSQGNAGTQTMLGGLNIHSLFANFLQYVSSKDHEN